jgi:hypothetical protein
VTQCSANRKISPILRPFLYFGRRTKTATENRQCWISVNNLSVLAEACFARAGRILRSGNKLSPKPAIGVRHIFLGISLALREVWRTKVQGGPVPHSWSQNVGPGAPISGIAPAFGIVNYTEWKFAKKDFLSVGPID